MTTPKCPLCGGSFELFEEGANIYLYQCLDCPLASSVSYTEKGALENAKELISKFPPIMRLNVGDNLTYFGTSDFVTVVRKDMESCEIQIETPEGELYIIEPKDVHKWPWELEQKGCRQ